MNILDKLKKANTTELRVNLAVEELYKLAEAINELDKTSIKKYLLYIIGVLKGMFR